MYYVIATGGLSIASLVQYTVSKSELSVLNLFLIFAELILLIAMLCSKRPGVWLFLLGLFAVGKVCFFMAYGLRFEAQFSCAILQAVLAAVRLALLCMDWPVLCEQVRAEA